MDPTKRKKGIRICTVFAFVKPGGNAPTGCWLKSTVPPRVVNAATVSGFVPGVGETQKNEPTIQGGTLILKPGSLPGSSFVLEPGVNRPGGYYGAIQMDGGPEECRQACAKDPKCKSFTWVKPGVPGNNAVCWVKTTVPAAQQNADTVSGVSSELTHINALLDSNRYQSFEVNNNGNGFFIVSAIGRSDIEQRAPQKRPL